jgi:hypothetical protein
VSRLRALVVALVVTTTMGGLAAVSPAPATAVAPTVATAGGIAAADTSGAPTDSAETITLSKSLDPKDPNYSPVPSNRGLSVTVSQTKNLQNQAVEVTWKGWERGENRSNHSDDKYYLHVMQCWGDDPAYPTTPRPDPRTCQSPVRADGLGVTNAETIGPWYGKVPALPASGGDPVEMSNYSVPRPQSPARYKEEDNEFWTRTTTNAKAPVINGQVLDEVFSSPAGGGAVVFEIQTGAESPFLGCGDAVPAGARPCWLVVVPRGSGNVNDGPETPVGASQPFSPKEWATNLAFRLTFNPAGQACPIGSAERRVAGTELLTDASLSWQRQLCKDGAVYSYTQLGDLEARRQLLTGFAGAPQMGVTVDPFDPGAGGFADGQGADYAPLGISGVVLAFSLRFGENGPGTAPPDIQALSGSRLRELKFTPRLVAKLLSMSYRDSLSQALNNKKLVGMEESAPAPASPAYEWGRTNPMSLVDDPDFRELNPNAKYWKMVGLSPTLPLDRTDAFARVWAWIMADPAARAWLAGEPDKWGMRVNPYYTTKASLNPTGEALELPRPDFPQADPWCNQYPLDMPSWSLETQESQQWLDNPHQPELCAGARLPYVGSMHEGAANALAGKDLRQINWPAKIDIADVGESVSSFKRWKASKVKQDQQMTITDAASALRYGLSVATLCTSDGSGCVTPTTASLTAALPALAPVAGTAVRQLDPAKVPPGAYPLTMLAYAAAPYGDFGGDGVEDRDPKVRADLARFITTAVTDGQKLGNGFGDLPLGYAPLPEYLRAEARAAAATIAARGTLIPAPATIPPKATTPPKATASGGAGANGLIPPLGGGTAQFAVPGAGAPGTAAATVRAAAAEAAAAAAAAAGDPLGAGLTSGPLAGSATPADPGAMPGLLLPGLLLGGLLTAAGVPLLGRRRRIGGDGL